MLGYSILQDMTPPKRKRTRHLNDRHINHPRPNIEDGWSQRLNLYAQWYARRSHSYDNGGNPRSRHESRQEEARGHRSQFDSILCFDRAMTESHAFLALNALNLPGQLSSHLTSQFRTFIIIEFFSLTASKHGKSGLGGVCRWARDDVEVDMGNYLCSSGTYALQLDILMFSSIGYSWDEYGKFKRDGPIARKKTIA